MTGKPAGNDDDRRQAHRYELALPLDFDHGRGRTLDISTSGVFFTTAAATKSGAHWGAWT